MATLLPSPGFSLADALDASQDSLTVVLTLESMSESHPYSSSANVSLTVHHADVELQLVRCPLFLGYCKPGSGDG